MLARLLRRLILSQIALGLGLGLLLRGLFGWPVWSVYLLGAAFPFGIMVLVDTVSALVSRNRSEPSVHWWRSLWGEYAAGIKVFLFRQPWTTRAPAVLPAIGSNAKVPVVLVHGYLCNHRIWDDMADALRARGHAVFAVNLEPVFCSIDRYAPIVDAAVRALLAHTGGTKVALVGHSMGGLAIRAWMRAHGTEHAARIITLGTPHAGTKIARGTTTPNGKQMAWRSAWLQELEAAETEAVRALMRIALTPQDNIVFHQRAQTLPGIAPEVFDGIGHVQMCLEPAVIQWVCAQLDITPDGEIA